MSDAADQVRLARAALTRICEPGSAGLARLIARRGPVGALEALWHDGDVPAEIARQVLVRRGRLAAVLAQAARDLDQAAGCGGRLICPEDAEWPPRLADLAAVGCTGDPAMPPVALWARGPGDLAGLCARSVSLVGSRAATSYGTFVAGEFGHGLVDREWTVISGGAYGIDGAAHRGALTAGGPTVAILASGVDRPYPLGHAGLFDRIRADGMLVSEWPPGCPPQRLRFLVRNRVIAAISAGTVVVEAAARSGARMTARRAAELNRPLMAVPGPVTSAMSVGAHQLLRSGAVLVTSAAEILDAVGRIGDDFAEPPRGPTTARDGLSPELTTVIEAVPARQAQPIPEIAARAGVRLRDAMHALPLLVNHGLVEEAPGGFRLTVAGRQSAAAGNEPAPLR
ncbi:MAG: DNA-processing protein DprA [Pseudonocardiales bacterium]